MISDALKLLQTIQAAKSKEEENKLEAELVDAVTEDIRKLFDDPSFKRRRRSFRAIRTSLGIFDAEQERLKRILYAMGARPQRGEGEEALWHLPKRNDSTRKTSRNPRFRWSRVYSLLGATAALVAILGIIGFSDMNFVDFSKLRFKGFSDFKFFTLGESQTRQDCLNDTSANMRKISKCYRDFP